MERERVPVGLGPAAPWSWCIPWTLLGAALGLAAGAALDFRPWSLGTLTAFCATMLADAHWRRTRPPSADAEWPLLAKLLFRRVPARRQREPSP